LQKTNSFVGVANMSPERVDGNDYSFSADVWALGVSLAAVALGKLPVSDHLIRDELSVIFSNECCDFIDSCVKKIPDERPTCKDLLRHPFLGKCQLEDLSEDFSDDANSYELRRILNALADHIEILKNIYKSKYSNDTSKFEENVPLYSVFGNIVESTTKDVLERFLFGDPSRRSNLHRSSLTTLAKQLHCPVQYVEREAKLFCEKL
jgi:serine/threonine protein kinase